jgi:exonuclease III/ribonuclease HI
MHANLRKSREVQLSFLNDRTLATYDLLMVSEPYMIYKENQRNTHTHNKWRAIMPNDKPGEGEAITKTRSMIWIRKDRKGIQQVETSSTDITAVIFHHHDRLLFAITAYVPPQNGSSGQEELTRTMNVIRRMIRTQQKKFGAKLDIVISGDFNRHDQLWGGDHIIHTRRQGEAQSLVELMLDYGLHSLLPRGTITYDSGHWQSTIDLVMASDSLKQRLTLCQCHPTEHGSDHRAIQATFTGPTQQRLNKGSTDPTRYMWKKAPWDEIVNRISQNMIALPEIQDPEELEKQLGIMMGKVSETLEGCVPQVRPSPYCKRWWTDELTELRNAYTYNKNQWTQLRRYGVNRPDMEKQVKQLRHRFHTAIRDQKRKHWTEFLEQAENIWTAAQYTKETNNRKPIPTLCAEGSGPAAETEEEKAKSLLSAFFPPTPESSEPLGNPNLPTLQMDPITDEEIKRAVMRMNPWKAPGEDQIPAGVWQQLWPALGKDICQIFHASIKLSYVPARWRIAKIIPLHKPGRDETLLNSYRPISLLSTLGKMLEAVIAQRLSYYAEVFGLLPPNHFGARKKRSSEQALNLLVEKIYEAWREKKVLSVVSFDVKGAYNGVIRKVLIRRLLERQIPVELVRWIDAFCSNRRASIIVNDYCSEAMEIAHPGLPQGSSLSPILYLFFNADLVEIPIGRNRGAMAFVDDFMCWRIGQSADENTSALQEEAIPHALGWAMRSGAIFEAQKTQVIHFTRNARQNPSPKLALRIGTQNINPSNTVKLLGVIFDERLRFREHVGRVTKRGIKASQALLRLRGLRPQSARQLYNALVVPTVTYASSVWITLNKHGHIPSWVVKPLHVIQKSAAKSITGIYRSVSLTIAEAEASIEPLDICFQKRILRHWIGCHSLPSTHPLAKCIKNINQQSRSPFGSLSRILPLEQSRMETIIPYHSAPWELDWQKVIRHEGTENTEAAFGRPKIKIYTYGSARNNLIGIGLAVVTGDQIMKSTSTTVETDHHIDLHTAQLGAILEALQLARELLQGPPTLTDVIGIIIYSTNQSSLQCITNQGSHGGQQIIQQIIRQIKQMRQIEIQLTIRWIANDLQNQELQMAKAASHYATQKGAQPDPPAWATQRARSTAWRQMRNTLNQTRKEQFLQNPFGKYTREIDASLPGRHTRTLYDQLSRIQASTLAQLRTGHNQLSQYLRRIGQADDETCECTEGQETVQHFLFKCKRWETYRGEMRVAMGNRYGDMSYALGGRSRRKKPTGEELDQEKNWRPNMEVVRTVIRFAMATGRLNHEN